MTCASEQINIELAASNALKIVCPWDENAPPVATPTAQPPSPESIIYVSPTGNDDGPGTLDQPLRTIQRGVDLASAGNTVYVREGIYNEQVIISNSGTSSAPLTVAAYPGETAVIDGYYQLPLNNGDWANCNTTVSPPKCFNYKHLVRLEGDHIILDGFEIRHSLGRGVVVYREDDNATGSIIRNNNIHNNRHAGILMHEAVNILVENNEVSYNANFATHDRSAGDLNWTASIAAYRSDQLVYRGNVVHHNYGEGLITANYDGSTNIIVEDNVFYDNFALQLYVHRSHNVTAQRNLIYCTDDPAFFRGRDITYGLIVFNEVPPEGFKDGLRTTNINILNNIVTGCQHNFGVWGTESTDRDYPIRNMLVAHNTFINARSVNSPDRAKNILWTNSLHENVRFENNIIYQEGGELIDISRNYPGLTFENNLWSDSPNPLASGAGDLIGNVNLANPNAPIVSNEVNPDWYRIQSSSSAIGAAKPLDNISDDFFGNSRDFAPDIGAHELSN